MQYFKALILAAATVLIFYSCNPCSSPSWTNLGCPEDDQLNKIRMVRKTDKKDLLFGLTRVYDVSQIKVFTVKGVDTTFLNVRAIKDIGYQYDSALSVRFFPLPDVAYMRLSDGDIDTFNFKKYIQKDRCCDPVVRIEKVLFNSIDWMYLGGGEMLIEK